MRRGCAILGKHGGTKGERAARTVFSDDRGMRQEGAQRRLVILASGGGSTNGAPLRHHGQRGDVQDGGGHDITVPSG